MVALRCDFHREVDTAGLQGLCSVAVGIILFISTSIDGDPGLANGGRYTTDFQLIRDEQRTFLRLLDNGNKASASLLFCKGVTILETLITCTYSAGLAIWSL